MELMRDTSLSAWELLQVFGRSLSSLLIWAGIITVLGFFTVGIGKTFGQTRTLPLREMLPWAWKALFSFLNGLKEVLLLLMDMIWDGILSVVPKPILVLILSLGPWGLVYFLLKDGLGNLTAYFLSSIFISVIVSLLTWLLFLWRDGWRLVLSEGLFVLTAAAL